MSLVRKLVRDKYEINMSFKILPPLFKTPFFLLRESENVIRNVPASAPLTETYRADKTVLLLLRDLNLG